MTVTPRNSARNYPAGVRASLRERGRKRKSEAIWGVGDVSNRGTKPMVGSGGSGSGDNDLGWLRGVGLLEATEAFPFCVLLNVGPR